jgi:NitT/TauT family transport system permease protein
MLELVRSLRASRWQVFMKIRFPNALPYIFTGLKLNATMSVIGAIVGEFVASERGLGALIITGGVTLQTPSIFASLGLISCSACRSTASSSPSSSWSRPWAYRAEAAN